MLLGINGNANKFVMLSRIKQISVKPFHNLFFMVALIALFVVVTGGAVQSKDIPAKKNKIDPNNFPVSTARYITFLNDNPKILNSITWRFDGKKKSLPQWDAKTRKQFFEEVERVERGAGVSLIEPPRPLAANENVLSKRAMMVLDKDALKSTLEYVKEHYNCPGEAVAKKVFFHHVAFSLKAELDHFFPWSIADLDPESLSLLFDIDSLYPVEKTSGFCFREVTHWNPELTCEFLKTNGIIRDTRKETIYSLTEWFRKKLTHSGVQLNEKSFKTANIRMWGRPWIPEVEMILNGSTREGNETIHYISGCWGASQLYREMLRPLNIPVRFGRTSFKAGVHSRVEFPTEGISLAHSDDPYLLVVAEPEIPTPEIFLSMEELNKLIINPLGRTCHAGEIECIAELKRRTEYNYRKHFLNLSVKHMALGLIMERVRYSPLDSVFQTYFHDYLKGIGPAWKTLADAEGNTDEKPVLGDPFFTDDEVNGITKEVDMKISEIGNGDWYRGAEKAVYIYEDNMNDEYFVRRGCQFEESLVKYPGGKPMILGVLFRGRPAGKWKTWYSNGHRKSEGLYSKGRKTGLWTLWYENGNISSSGNYSGNSRIGNWIWLSQDGRVLKTGIYQDRRFRGVIRDMCSPDGSKLQEWSFSNGSGELKLFENGQIFSSEEFKGNLLLTVFSDECGGKGKTGVFTGFRHHGLTTNWNNHGNITNSNLYYEETLTPPIFPSK